MKLKFVYKVLPVLCFIQKALVPSKYNAKNYGFFIAFDSKYSFNDVALVQHELQHSKQFFRLPLLHSLLYRFSKEYRYKSELEAYAVQLSNYSREEQFTLLDYFTKMIYTKYNLSGYKDYFEIMQDLEHELQQIRL